MLLMNSITLAQFGKKANQQGGRISGHQPFLNLHPMIQPGMVQQI
ncbi:hypothetical protein PLCT2_02318 [Planctomycetaceae bacterium]|nr:hypothetical protein PLCT2_02318 [Planctomycetaceae bacterium]